MNVAQINQAILAGNFSNEDLNAIASAVGFVRSQLVRKVTFTLRAGAKVKWTNSRSLMVCNGTVEKVNRKFVLVRNAADGLRWRIPGNMLTSI
jgi:hypothetical protein